MTNSAAAVARSRPHDALADRASTGIASALLNVELSASRLIPPSILITWPQCAQITVDARSTIRRGSSVFRSHAGHGTWTTGDSGVEGKSRSSMDQKFRIASASIFLNFEWTANVFARQLNGAELQYDTLTASRPSRCRRRPLTTTRSCRLNGDLFTNRNLPIPRVDEDQPWSVVDNSLFNHEAEGRNDDQVTDRGTSGR